MTNEILAKKILSQIKSRPGNNDTPVGRMGEDEDRTRLSEGARQSSVRSTATSSGREADIEGSKAERCKVLEGWSMIL